MIYPLWPQQLSAVYYVLSNCHATSLATHSFLSFLNNWVYILLYSKVCWLWFSVSCECQLLCTPTITHSRYTPLHFNPKLYEYVTHELQKQLIVVLNKCDIVPADVVTAWKHYLLKEFPKLDVVVFTSFPKDEETRQALAKGKTCRKFYVKGYFSNNSY